MFKPKSRRLYEAWEEIKAEAERTGQDPYVMLEKIVKAAAAGKKDHD